MKYFTLLGRKVFHKQQYKQRIPVDYLVFTVFLREARVTYYMA